MRSVVILNLMQIKLSIKMIIGVWNGETTPINLIDSTIA